MRGDFVYRPDEMAMILEQAKRYTNSQRLGYTEKKVLIYDGNPDIREYQDNGMVYQVKVTDEVIDPDTVTKVIYTMATGDTITLSRDNGELKTFNKGEVYSGVLGSLFGAEGMVVAIQNPPENSLIPTGTFLLGYDNYGEMTGYVSYVELETVNPIPQEYVPPLDRLILNGADGNQYALTITDGALSVAPVTT